MKLRILGCDGGHAKDANATSLLINDNILIDAGTIMSKLDHEDLLKIEHVFISHSHLDHIYDLPFFLDATFAQGIKPVKIYGSDHTLSNLSAHFFNNIIWPDFANLPGSAPQFSNKPIYSGETVDIGGIRITPISVNHIIPTYGFLVEGDTGSFLFSSDTGPTSYFWDIANRTESLKAVIIDLAFPNRMQRIAEMSGHNTPNSLAKELKKFTADCDVYAFHFKVGVMEEIKGELRDIKHKGNSIKVLREVDEIDI